MPRPEKRCDPVRSTASTETRASSLQIFALSSLAVAQPLLDLLARDADFFVVRRVSDPQVVLLAIVLAAVVPLPLAALSYLARRISPRLGEALHGVILGGLATLLAFQAMTRFALLDAQAWLLAGLAAGCVFLWAFHRFAALRLVTRYLGFAVVVVPVVFLLNPRILKLIAGEATFELGRTKARTPIVFLLLDELSLTALLDESRQIDAASYPNLAAFAESATWFSDAMTVSDVTELAVPAMLTGTMPGHDELPILEDYPRNLFTLLGGSYKIWAVEPITRLCPPAINLAQGGSQPPRSRIRDLYADLWIVYQHLLLPPSYAENLPVISDRWQGFRGTGSAPEAAAATPRPDKEDFFVAAIQALRRDRQEDLARFVDAFDPDEDQALYFLHILLPHTPWEFMPTGKSYWTPRDRVTGLTKEIWGEEESFLVDAYRRYLLQVRFVDMWFGRIVDRLRELGLYDRSIIVFAADHGVSFRPGDSRRAATPTNYTDLIPVPLLVKAPFQDEAQVVDHPVSTLDILPTILDFLDVRPPPSVDGRSVFGEKGPSTSRTVVGKFRTFDLGAEIEGGKYDALDWKLKTFGTDSSGIEVFRAGVAPELFGHDVAELSVERQRSISVQFEGDTLFRRHEVYSPSFVSGTLVGADSDPDCCEIAVAVNDTIQATVRAHRTASGEVKLNALVPDEAFLDGQNRVSVYRIRHHGSKPVLETLGSTRGAPYSLVTDEAGVVSIRHESGTFPIRKSAVDGYFSTSMEKGRWKVYGWSVDRETGGEPERILVFYDGELLHGGFNDRVREEVNAKLGLDPELHTGFHFELPSTRAPDIARHGLRLFAVSRQVASELGFFYTLEAGEDGRIERIRTTSGQVIPVHADSFKGYVEEAHGEDDSRLLIGGWAVDATHLEPPEKILVFADGKLVNDGRTSLLRRDVAAALGLPEDLTIGFKLAVQVADAPSSSRERLLVFAVSGRGNATLLPYLLPPEGRAK